MSSNTLIIARRIINQLIRDRRTIALLVIVPLVIASLVGVAVPVRACWTIPPRQFWRCLSSSSASS